MKFIESNEMKVNLTLAQSKMLSTKEDIKIIIKDSIMKSYFGGIKC